MQCREIHHRPKFSTDTLHARYPEPREIPATGTEWIIVRDEKVAATAINPPAIILSESPDSAGFSVANIRYMGHRGETALYCAGLKEGSATPQGWDFFNPRELFGRIPDEELALAALAVQLIGFDATTRFCGRCGGPMDRVLTERAKRCPSCNLVEYPHLSPAIIVLVSRGDQVLLARSPRFTPGMYSVIAGFVEPGENLEHAVHRELVEETGIRVKNIRYFASEPWPFPHSLMIGFTAEYQDGEIAIDHHEIEAAAWFDREHLPPIPPKMSIARALIDWWVGGETG